MPISRQPSSASWSSALAWWPRCSPRPGSSGSSLWRALSRPALARASPWRTADSDNPHRAAGRTVTFGVGCPAVGICRYARQMTRIGAHLHDGDPLAQAKAIGSDAVQFFLGDPQGWKAPTFPGEPAEVRAAFEAAGIDAYVHSPYVINVASPNNRIRIPSRKAIERIERPLPMLIENTAGGDGAMARGLDGIARLWDAIGAAADGGGEVGFCLDTCHAFASGEDLATIVQQIKAITGRIDLVHCNNSRDEFGSGRDRHAGME